MDKDIRHAGLNWNRWWPMMLFLDLMPSNGLQGRTLGEKDFLIVQRKRGRVDVYVDACPHKLVRLSQYGELVHGKLRCRYHGWDFDAKNGNCVSLGSMEGNPENFPLSSLPAKCHGGWVWAFLGDPKTAESMPLPDIPPIEEPQGYFAIPMQGKTASHFSFISENATDLFHAPLHSAQQPWENPKLMELTSDDEGLLATYSVTTPRVLAALFTKKRQTHVFVKYAYPYIHIYEESGGFYLFVTYLPETQKSTFVTSQFFFRPVWGQTTALSLLLKPFEWMLKPQLRDGVFQKVFAEDIQAVEEEQRAYDVRGQDETRDPNPVTHAVRKIILAQTRDFNWARDTL